MTKVNQKQTTEDYIQTRIQIDDETGCWNWTGTPDKDGYGKAKREGKTLRSHRLSYSHYKGVIPDGMFVCHTCDNPKCVNPDHLWTGTHKENELDKDRKNRRSPSPSISHPHLIPKGETHHKSKLTNETVETIYKLGLEHKSAKEIKDILGLNVCCTSLNRIINGSGWSHLNLKEKYGEPLPQNIGERNPTSKLTAEKVLFIRSSDLSNPELARLCNVNSTTIHNVRSFRTWKHLQT